MQNEAKEPETNDAVSGRVDPLVRLQAAREYAAKIHHRLAASAFDPDFGFASHITEEDKQKYSDDQRRYAAEVEAGEHDSNFTIWQRMNYFLTGECTPFLPKY